MPPSEVHPRSDCKKLHTQLEMALNAPQNFAFIPVEGNGKANARERKLIRSHCMNGKNLRIGVHPVPDDTSPRESDKWRQEPKVSRRLGYAKAERPLDELSNDSWFYSAPSAAPSDMSLFQFAGEVDYSSRLLISNFYTKATETMGPAERCVDFGPSGQLWFPYLAKYAGFTHPILFCISVADCLLGNKPLGKKAQYHLGETLVFINQRLSDNTTALHDSTIFVVLALIDFSAYLRDYKTAMVHLKGLGEMVRLRGGIDNFRYLPRLYTKLGRLDLIQALYSGNKPVFLVDTTSCPRISEDVDFWSAHGGTSLPQSAGNLGLKNEVLLAAFTDLRQLSEVLNTKTASCRRLDVAVFQARVCSIQYRLLWLQGTLDDCLAECLRLAMLAFLATTFHVPLAVAQYPYLANHYRESCAAMGARNLENLPLWFLMVGALSVFGVEDAWLQERWRAEVPPQLAWDEARLQLRDIMWIDTIHNQPGERVFQILKCGRVEGAHRSTSRSKLWVGGWVGTTYELY